MAYYDSFRQATEKEFKKRNTNYNFDDFYKEYTSDAYWKKQAGHDAIGGTKHHAVRYHRWGHTADYEKAINIDLDNWIKRQDLANNPPPVAESTQQAQSTVEATQRAAQTGVPSIDNMSTEAEKDTETKKRQNKSKGKRGFVVARESGQGISI